MNEGYTFLASRMSCGIFTIRPILIKLKLSHEKTSIFSFTYSRADPLWHIENHYKKQPFENPFCVFHTTTGVDVIGHCFRNLIKINVNLGKDHNKVIILE